MGKALEHLSVSLAVLGLRVNLSKCELYGSAPVPFNSILSGIRRSEDPDSWTYLSCPLAERSTAPLQTAARKALEGIGGHPPME